MATIYKFQDLKCWKACREVVRSVSEILKNLPKNEYELVDNMKRAVRSTTRNIAEGFGRHHFQETMQYSRISRGSMQETWDDLITCFEAGYIEIDVYNKIEQQIIEAIALINGYIAYLERSKK